MKPSGTSPERTVHTVCPLDCPDACHLQVTVQDGRVVAVDGAASNPITGGYICAKVRRFADHVYGSDRVLYPAIRKGPKGLALFERVSWDTALDRIADQLSTVRREHGGEAILPYSYGGSNGLLTQDTSDAMLFARLGASRLLRTVCAAPTGAANLALYGKMPSVSYEDIPDARLILVWGNNPSVSGLHVIPFIREAQRRGARLVVIDPRTTPLAKQADLHLPVRPGTDLPLALALHRHLFESGAADQAFLATHTRGADRLRARADTWTFERAADEAGVSADAVRQLAEWYAATRPALIKCGWGLERNRNGGSAALAILALPAVAGAFGQRGGGYIMSNSASWGITNTWADEAPGTRAINMNQLGRALTEASPAVRALFVYNSNPVATTPHQRLVTTGLERDDLFTVVFDAVMTDTARYADVLLPATTFLEGYDLVKGYGPWSLRLGPPAIEPVGEARSNAEVFGSLIDRLDLRRDEDAVGELEEMLHVLGQLPASIAEPLRHDGVATPPFGGRPIQFVDVFPRTDDQRVDVFPEALDAETPSGLYVYQSDPATARYPLALISPASERSTNSTLAQLPRPEVRLLMHPTDAASRGLSDGDDVRVFNDRGDVRCKVGIGGWIRPGTVSLPKGLWRRHTANGNTSTALVPDTLTDFGGGACFNDARVEVERFHTTH